MVNPCALTSAAMGLSEIDPVLDVDRVDVRIAADREADGQRVAAVIAAGRSHVDRFVDAVDLGLDRLGDARFDRGRARAGKGRGDRDLRGDDVWILRDRNAGERNEAREHHHDRDDEREARSRDENVGDHGPD